MLDAHERNDKTILVQLYSQAGDIAEKHADSDAARFYLTQAYVFALDTGSEEHEVLKKRLDILAIDSTTDTPSKPVDNL